MGGKWLEALKEIAPRLVRVEVLFSPDTAPYAANLLRAIDAAAPTFAVEPVATPIHNATEIERAIGALAAGSNAGLLVLPDVTTVNHRELIAALAARHRLPAVYPFKSFINAGGLMSYGIDAVDVFRQAAAYVDRILRGARPDELPVQAPNKFELVINLKAAKALGLDVPPMMLARADEVIE